MTSPSHHPSLRLSPRHRAAIRPLAVLLGLAMAGAPAAAARAAPPVQLVQAAEDSAAGEAGEPAPRFFEELDDLPLMAGLQEMSEAGVAFDKPAGRIGEAYAEGAVPAEEVRAFYAETLPHLGWEPVAESRYRREGEQLELEVSEAQGVTTLRLSLSPTD